MKDTTTTIDDEIDRESEQALILEEAYNLGYHKVKNGCLIEPLKKLNQWHKQQARSYVLEVIGDEKSFERMFDGKAIVFEKDGTQYPAIPLYTAVMTLKRYRRTIDQTLKAIEESK